MAVISKITGLALQNFNSLRKPAGFRPLSNKKNDPYLYFLNNGQKTEKKKSNPHFHP